MAGSGPVDKLTRLQRGLAVGVPVALALALTPQLPAWGAPRKKLTKPAAVSSVPGAYRKPAGAPLDATATQNVHAAPKVQWPAATTADVALPAAAGTDRAADSASAFATPPGLPISVARAVDGPASVRVAMLAPDGKVGAVHSVQARITRTDQNAGADGAVRVALSYAGFRDAYGGDWASRLRLVRLPDCALTTPAAAGCRAVDLRSVNDSATGTVSATVPLSGGGATAASAVVALASSPQPANGGGDYSATALQATSSWSAGGQSGDFTWTYPIRTPPSLGGPAPGVSLSYSSQSLDGKTAATNNQPSWAGEGFDYTPGAINRTYTACVDDGKTGVGDLCWATDNATMSLPGHAGELIQASTSPDVWKLKDDDGTKIERLTGAVNGARNGEYWRATTTDGWQYYFGLNRLPGWSTNKAVTQSVFTVPVFGNNTNEPCNTTTYANSWCDQAYEWNLDYVVDPHGNSMSMWYAQQINHYGRNITPSSVSTYVRGGQVDHIDYGTRLESGTDSEYTNGVAPARVVFGTSDRCITPGSTCIQSNPSNWPDVPWDQQCDSTTSCLTALAPTFFTQKQLSTITTQVWTGTGTTYRNVEQWTFKYVFKDPGDGHAKILWLSGIGHAGLDGTTVTVPDVTFNSVQLNNRVDKTPSKDPIIRYRISSIVNEAGGVTAVTYSAPECVTGSKMPASPDTNTLRCFPVYWTPYGQNTPIFDWFHKYVVTGVTNSDPIGGAPAEVTTYSYLDAPAWHYDISEVVPAAHKAWGQWRGYSKVRVTTGSASTAQTQTDTVFFRGMNGDKTATSTRSVQLAADPDFGGTAINDEDWRNGQTREEILYNGVGDTAPVVSKTLSTPWEFGPTATRTRNNVKTDAYISSTRSSSTKLALDAGRGWLTTSTTNTFDTETGLPDPIGRIVKVDSANDTATTADDRCTTTTYATDPGGRIRSAVARALTVSVRCAATPNLATDVVSDARTWYDGATSFDATVTKGDATRSERVSDMTGGVATYITENDSTYDKYGRVLSTKDPLGFVTSTAYTPAAGALPTSVTTTNPKGWISTVTYDTAYGIPTSKVDPNNARTDLENDAFGRLTKVWLPDRDKTTQTPSETYTYVVGGPNSATSVASATLNPAGNGYITSYDVYDGLMRKRQTQTPAVGGGAVFTDVIYDSRGLAVQANNAYFNAGVSWGNIFVPSGAVPGRTLTTYDNAGRAAATIFQVKGVEKWRSTTTFGGDHTDTTAPAGGTGKTVYMNALGQITELRQYHGNSPTGAYDATSYTFDTRGNPATIVGPDHSTWTFSYDLLGRNTKTIDPDRGTSNYTYDNADQQLTVIDGRNIKRTNVYDELGRVIARYQGDAATGTLLAGTTYDTLKKGLQSSTSRYVNGHEYKSAITGYDAANRPTGATITIPPNEGALAGTYTTSSLYNADGSVATTTLPAIGTGAGAQPQETLTFGYNTLGMPTTLSGANTYVTGTAYDSLGRLSTLTTNDGGAKTLAQLWTYEDGTNRLTEHGVYDNDTGNVFQDQYSTYDNVGDLTSLKDLTNQYGAGPDDNQCFTYDYVQRLSAAWTPTNGNCATAPTTGALGGPAPYWQSWTYDAAGDRLSQTDHTAAGNITAQSTLAATNGTQPHSLRQVDTTNASGSTSTTSSYTYDAGGNTITRQRAGKPTQTLTWDAEGHLAGVTDANSTASYIYDAGGNRLIAHDSTGATLYLGPQQLHIASGGQVSTTRFYGSYAVRTSSGGLSWLSSDHHGTNDLVFRASDLSKTQRRSTPFGGPRGTATTWPTDRGFVGGLDDPTGLTQLGARPYDTALGRFMAVDPLFNSGDPQSFNGYAYAGNNPVTDSDPSGLMHEPDGGSDSGHWTNLGNRTRHYTKGGYNYTEVGFFLGFCRSDGRCLTGSGTWVPKYVVTLAAIALSYVVLFVSRTKINGYGPYLDTSPHQTIDPRAACPTPPPPPPPPPTCGFTDYKCGWKHPGWWWQGNKGWVEGGLAVVNLAACLTGVGCLVTSALGAGVSAADRTYSFAHNKEYNEGATAWGGLALGLGLDALGAIPGEGAAAHGAAESVANGGVYTLRDEAGNVVRTGRTKNLAARETAHANDPVLGDFQFNVEYRTDVYAEQRGLEQLLYDRYPGAQAANGGFNKIRAVSPWNPNYDRYMDSARNFLGGG